MTDEMPDTANRAEAGGTRSMPELVLCAVDEALYDAWLTISDLRPYIRVHRGSVLDVPAQAVVSPANSYGRMRGGIDALYSHTFPQVEHRVQRVIRDFHGGELPVSEALAVPTGISQPAWLISAPTMRQPGEFLPSDTTNPYLAARAVLTFWVEGELAPGRLARHEINVIAMPGLGTGVGGVTPENCAQQVATAWDEIFVSGVET